MSHTAPPPNVRKNQSALWFLYLEDLEGGQSRDLWRGANLETFSGKAQLKKHPVSKATRLRDKWKLHDLLMLYLMQSSKSVLYWQKWLPTIDLSLLPAFVASSFISSLLPLRGFSQLQGENMASETNITYHLSRTCWMLIQKRSKTGIWWAIDDVRFLLNAMN